MDPLANPDSPPPQDTNPPLPPTPATTVEPLPTRPVTTVEPNGLPAAPLTDTPNIGDLVAQSGYSPITPTPLPFEPPKKSKLAFLKPSKKLAVIVALFALFGGGASAFYFGYYTPNQPADVWSSALSNTGKGYDKLSQYATSSKKTKGISVKGSFKLSGLVAADGTFSGASENNNSQLTGSISAVGLKINLDVRTIASAGNSPDVYFKVDGIAGLGTLFGNFDPTYTTALNGLNNTWYLVDHTLFDQFAQGSNSNLQLSSQDVSSALKAVGDASKSYVFTKDEQKMAFKVSKYVGKEKVDNRNTYYYKVSVDKTNLKAYVKALCTNLKASKINKFFDGTGQSIDQALSCQNGDTTINNIDASGSADVWVDLHTKLIHKIRFTDKTNKSDYFDIAQDYQGGDVFPFSVSVNDKNGGDTTVLVIKMSLNMKTNTFSMDGSLNTTGVSDQKGTFNLVIAPSTAPVKVEAPTGAKNIIELLNDLGISQLISDANSGSSSSAQSELKDNERKADIGALSTQAEVYYANSSYYPTLDNFNDPAWRSKNMGELYGGALQDPDGSAQTLASVPGPNVYSYQALPAGCDNTFAHRCQDYILTATLGTGATYVKQGLNGPASNSI